MGETADNASAGARPDRTAALTRGVIRFLTEAGFGCLAEFTLRTGRRVDVVALDGKGGIAVVEVKSSLADFRSDGKWREYLAHCDRFYFAVGDDFPQEVLPEDCGLILADAWGAAILREAPENPVPAARRKAVTLRYARTAAQRLTGFTDPDWMR